ncbi:alpha/beta hydrolase [Rhodococcus sp. APC 3903]|uniref:alpha/beta fold hydrolase n=1 Tax=Rhodococcus sp. APC 3903 TaxID=3035193 RepID=UPI0025B45458|nr:alpha/beta hydrolase [Rhodococcus sp. APC 3903]MDN3460785.1 alpha/beta hydrolase [Rhodococcus sp. APC 3903]
MTTTIATEKIYVRDAGDGPNVMMLHGIGGSSESFTPQFDELAGELRMLAWDAPGYARSADPDRENTLDDYADIVAALIVERCGDAGVHLLGMSWGGVIATRVALRHPALVRSLALGSSTVGSAASEESAAAMRARVGHLTELGPAEFARARAPKLLSAQSTPDEVAGAVDLMGRSIRLAGYSAAAASMAATDHTTDLARITVPTLVLCGDEDTITGLPASQKLAGGIGGAVIVTVHGAGHLANQERPEAFNAWFHSFVLIAEQLRNH